MLWGDLPGYLAEMVLPLPDRRSDNEIQTEKFVVPEHLQMAVRLYDSQVCRAEISFGVIQNENNSKKNAAEIFLIVLDCFK